ncbi:N-acetyltransferase [Halocatena pleomorpha]|uniref:N-acetyltransferase n=2 Tax=Halocatena pleomorpha TaxID=1785090 RepID=A0A3P3R532_9EURY|nr:N-acetyltransferase [Halocatena pleomorpha]
MLPTVMAILDAALLDIAVETVRDRLSSGAVLVATEEDRILGTVVLNDTHIEAIAVRPNRRGQGIGTALVDAASTRGRLTAAFRPGVSEFYESLGFDIERTGDRWRGVTPTAR